MAHFFPIFRFKNACENVPLCIFDLRRKWRFCGFLSLKNGKKVASVDAPICSTSFSRISAIRPVDGAFLFSANPASIRGLCEEWSRRGFSPESFSPRPSRRLRVQFPPEFSVSYRRRPIGFRELKSRFGDVMRCFRHVNRVFRNQRSSESWGPFWNFPSKFA